MADLGFRLVGNRHRDLLDQDSLFGTTQKDNRYSSPLFIIASVFLQRAIAFLVFLYLNAIFV